MSLQQARSLEHIGPQHQGLLAALALEGIDTSPVVGGATRLVGYGATKHGFGPACLLDLIGTEYVMEPHIIWFPWTTPQQRIAHFRWAIELMRGTHHLLFNVEKSQIGFFEHFVKRGLLRKIGVIEDLPIVEEIHMYQVKRRIPNEQGN